MSLNNESTISSYVSNLYISKYELINAHLKSINSIKISPDGKTFATCSSDKFIKLFNLEDGTLIKKFEAHTKGLSDICFSPIDSNYLASCSDDMTIKIWNLTYAKCIKTLRKHTYHVNSIRFNHKGNMLVSGSSDETIAIWDIKSGKVLKVLSAHSDPISSIDFTYDSSIIISGSYDGLIRLFDTDSGQCLKTLIYDKNNTSSSFPISYVKCSPNGKYILSSSLDGVIRLWDFMNNKVVKTFFPRKGDIISEKYNCGTSFITCTGNPLIASGTESSKVIIWDVQTKEILSVLENSEQQETEEPHPIFEIDVYKEGELLISCSQDGTVHLWEMNESYRKSTTTIDESQNGTVRYTASPSETPMNDDDYQTPPGNETGQTYTRYNESDYMSVEE